MIDVFASGAPLRGNPLAVVLEAEGLTTEQMAAFSAWTNLSECTSVLPPTDPAADYWVRIDDETQAVDPRGGLPTTVVMAGWVLCQGIQGGTAIRRTAVGFAAGKQ